MGTSPNLKQRTIDDLQRTNPHPHPHKTNRLFIDIERQQQYKNSTVEAP